MKEEYIRKSKIIEKSESEKQKDMIIHILKTKKELEEITKNYEYAEGELIDCYAYQIKANHAKLNYLMKQAKEQGIQLDMIHQIEIKLNEAI